ncbi:MAG: type II toxin-antitoxin system VapC family toxin [Gemmataceae bacterium]
MYILDTDVLTLFQTGHVALVQKILANQPRNISVAVISVEEQLTGWYTRLRRAKQPPELAHVYQRMTIAIRFLASFDLITFSEPAIHRYISLRKIHRGIGKNDLRIAAIAMEFNATIVTRNVNDFVRIPGLAVEDWTT